MIKSLNKRKKKKGFTLIELIIVFAVLAIIAAIAIPNLIAVKNHSKSKADTASAAAITRATKALIADGTITGDGIYDVTFDSSTGKLSDVIDDSTKKSALADLKSELSDTTAPQDSTDYNGYQITISGQSVGTAPIKLP